MSASREHQFEEGLMSPARNAIEVTPDDDVDLEHESRAVYVGGAGDLTAIMAGNGLTVTFVGVVAGTVLPIRVTRVTEATTATDVVALF